MEDDMIVSFELGMPPESYSDESSGEPSGLDASNFGLGESNRGKDSSDNTTTSSRLARSKLIKRLFQNKNNDNSNIVNVNNNNNNSINMDDTLSSESVLSLRKSKGKVSNFFQQNPNVRDDNKSTDEMLHLSIGMQNIQMELMQLMQGLHVSMIGLNHNFQEDFSPRFDMLENLISTMYLPIKEKIETAHEKRKEEEVMRINSISSRFDKLEKLVTKNAQGTNESLSLKLDRLETLITAKHTAPSKEIFLSSRLDKLEELLLSNLASSTEGRRISKRTSYTWNGRESHTSNNSRSARDRNFRKKPRKAVVAEKVQHDYNIKKVPKSEEIKQIILQVAKSKAHFHACCEEEITDLIHAFDFTTFTSTSVILAQGENLDHFFVIETGIVDVFIDGEHVSSLNSKGSFGEESFVGCTATSTCRARDNCKLWSIHRKDFRNITGQYRRKRLGVKTKFLKNVKFGKQILGNVLDSSDIEALALATRSEYFENGSEIMKEGVKGETFYMVESGTVHVFKKSYGQKPLVTLSKGNFFGEKSLFSNDVRTETCVAHEKVKCLILVRDDFVRLFGDLQELLDKSQKMVDESFQKENYEAVVTENKIETLHEERRLNLKLEHFDVKHNLGFGSFSAVKFVTLNKIYENKNPFANKEESFALKCSTKQKLQKHNLMENIRNEKEILKEVNHPFIIKFYYEFEDADFIYFLLEAVQGKELYSVLCDECSFSEECSRFYAASVLLALSDIHRKKIAYRDLKPENLMLDSAGFIKMVDFGFAKKVDKGKTFTFCGTPDYFAPEVICNEGHDIAVDYWGLGVLIFEMVYGWPPFSSDSEFEVYQNIMSGRINFPSDFSPDFKNLVSCLCITDQSKRLGRTKGGSETVMEHPWFSGVSWETLLSKQANPPIIPSKEGGYNKSVLFQMSNPYEDMQPATEQNVPKLTQKTTLERISANQVVDNSDKQGLEDIKSIDEVEGSSIEKSPNTPENCDDSESVQNGTKGSCESSNNGEILEFIPESEEQKSSEKNYSSQLIRNRGNYRKESYTFGRNRYEDKLKTTLERISANQVVDNSDKQGLEDIKSIDEVEGSSIEKSPNTPENCDDSESVQNGTKGSCESSNNGEILEFIPESEEQKSSEKNYSSQLIRNRGNYRKESYTFGRNRYEDKLKTTLERISANQVVDNSDKQGLEDIKSIDEVEGSSIEKSPNTPENCDDSESVQNGTKGSCESSNNGEILEFIPESEEQKSSEKNYSSQLIRNRGNYRKESYTFGRNRYEDKLKEFISIQHNKQLSQADLSFHSLNSEDTPVSRKNEALIVNEESLKKLNSHAKGAWKFALKNAVETETSSSAVIATSETKSENDVSISAVPLQKTAGIINSWLTGIRSSSNKKSRVRNKSFEQFYLFSAELENLTLQSFDFGRDSRYLDPLSCKTIELVDCYPYPYTQSKNSFSPEDVSAFCFPFGARFRLFPRCAIERAKKMGWIGKDGDNYQIHTFTGATGETKYGVSITVREEVICPMYSILKTLREQRRAAKILCRFVRKSYLPKHSSNTLKSRQSSNTLKSLLFRKRESVNNEGKGSKAIIKDRISDKALESILTKDCRRLSDPTPTGGFGLNFRRLSDTLGRLNESRSSDNLGRLNVSRSSDTLGRLNESRSSVTLGRLNESRSGSIPFDGNATFNMSGARNATFDMGGVRNATFDMGGVRNATFDMGGVRNATFNMSGVLGAFEEVTEISRDRARESYNIMLKNDELGEVCIMEKCFVFIGTTLEELSLMFCALQSMIDFERKNYSANFKDDVTRKVSNIFVSHAKRITNASSLRKVTSVERHVILEAMQEEFCLSYEQLQIQYPIKELDHIQRKVTYFEPDLAIQGFPKISLPLPLPRMSSEWGVATLLLRTNATLILTLTNLLLLERSLLVIGTSYNEVTSCTLALLELLAPFKWASAFMPLIPRDMLDFVGSPVPFIAGLVTDKESDLQSIEEDYRVQNAISEGMSVLNMTSGRVIVTREKGMEEIVHKYPCPTHRLDYLKNRLESLCRAKKSSLSSFKLFFLKGPSSQESVTICSIKRTMYNHYKSLFGFVAEHPEEWDKYGEFDEINKNFEFFPSRLVTPLQIQLQFQGIMVHTQLFQTFVEERKHFFKSNDLVPTAALQIAHWGQRKWRDRSKKKNRVFLDTLARGLFLTKPAGQGLALNKPAGQKSRKPDQNIRVLNSVLSMI